VRNYEVVFCCRSHFTSEELDALSSRPTVVEGKNGKVVKVDNWGKKSLAYKIKRYREGYYVCSPLMETALSIAEWNVAFR